MKKENGRPMMVRLFLALALALPTAAFAVVLASPEGGHVNQKLFHFQVNEAPPLMKITWNGIPFLAKSEGSFSREMMASRGQNTICVSAWDSLAAPESVSFYADVPPTALKIYLFWDTDNTDLDMHVVEPDKTECYYGLRDTPLGGRLDVDVTTGYGPEIYTMEYPNPGEYTVFVHFFGGAELTECTVVTVQNEGAGREKRNTYALMLTQPGAKVQVAKVEVR